MEGEKMRVDIRYTKDEQKNVVPRGLVLLIENDGESKLVDAVMGDEVGEGGLISVGRVESRLSDGFGEHYLYVTSDDRDEQIARLTAELEAARAEMRQMTDQAYAAGVQIGELTEQLRQAKAELAQWRDKAQAAAVDSLHVTKERDVVANERDRLMEELEAARAERDGLQSIINESARRRHGGSGMCCRLREQVKADRDRWKAAAGRLEVLAKRLAVSYGAWAGGGVGADCLAEIAAALAGAEREEKHETQGEEQVRGGTDPSSTQTSLKVAPEPAKEAAALTKEEKAEVDYWRTVNRDLPIRSTTDLLAIIDRLTSLATGK